MKILDETILYENKNFYPAFPSIIGLEKNKYLVSFRLAPKSEKNYSHLHSLSKAIVSTVYKNKIVNMFELGEDDSAAKQDPQLFRADDKTILGYYFRYSFHPINEKNLFKDYTFIEYNNSIALLDGIGLCVSSDNGKTFSKPNIIKLKNGMKNFAIRGNMIKIENEILAPIYAYKKTSNKNKKDKYQCYIISSKDFINWEMKTLLCETEINKNKKIEYFEPSLISYKNNNKNNIIAFIRTHFNNEYGYTSVAYSTDNGKTFSKPEATNIKGYPLNPLFLKDDKILLTYGYRLKPYGIRARILKLSEIKNINNIVEYIDNSSEIIIDDKMKNADCGYPSCINDNDNIICVYYGCNGKSAIRKIFMKKFILY
ncbi:sialidase family protein [Brachyspira catarrhinii]|uniref:Exo-alpha-sialidase n=1 Tax=Brachyspira catarrhinii TaxID=2528966 RepID=A0ABY2TU32_9SPIR|nr:sialidase family protein [Brachyspira catarrhinii]TKZ36404.1 exo-alpha-sialidase [Brachyspira catarrhinii]